MKGHMIFKYSYQLIIIVFVLTSSVSCNLKSTGSLFITDETLSETEIITLKILEQNQNQLNEKNILSDYREVVSFGGYKWLAFDIPEGQWDVYIEYYTNGDFTNKREAIFIKGSKSDNEWVAVWFVNNFDLSVMTEYGKGDLNINSSLFY